MGYSDLSIRHLTRSDLILIMLPNNSNTINEYLLMPLVRKKPLLYVICQNDSLVPCDPPSLKSQLRLPQDSLSLLILTTADLKRSKPAGAYTSSGSTDFLLARSLETLLFQTHDDFHWPVRP